MRLTRRTLLAGLLTLSASVGVGLVGAHVLAHPKRHSSEMPPHRAAVVSAEIESPSGYAFDSYLHGGQRYVAGIWGRRYNVRLTNHTDRRVEVVLSVDGRDVVSGELGDYRKQRGYVIGAYGSIVVEGYRQSQDHVAAFRFSDLGASYSSRLGTPQHVGVIGMAVFQERRSRARQPPHRPVTPYGRDEDGRATRGAAPGYSESAPAESGARDGSGRGMSAKRPASNHAADAEFESAPPSSRSRQSGSRHARPAPKLGTQYGETTYSAVRETTFRRRSARRPDQLVTIRYDSRDGLRAQGVPVDPPYYGHDHGPYAAPPPPGPYPYGGYGQEPQPFPRRQYAQPAP